MMDLFLTNMQLFTKQDINWWTGVVWIIVMFLSAVWTLILTAPIHCRASIAEQVIKSVLMKTNWKTETKYSLFVQVKMLVRRVSA